MKELMFVGEVCEGVVFVSMKTSRKSLVRFYAIPTIVGYLMPNPLYTYILNTYDLVWLGFMAYQRL